jgi:hypothetical protein
VYRSTPGCAVENVARLRRFGVTGHAAAPSCRPWETPEHAALESTWRRDSSAGDQGNVFWRTTVQDRNLSSVTQAGLVNNLNDGIAWGPFPLVFAAAGMELATIGLPAAVCPAHSHADRGGLDVSVWRDRCRTYV